MQVAVTGKQIDVGEALQTYVRGELPKSVNKYFDAAVGASVVFSKESHLFRVDIIVNEGTSTKFVVKADATATDIYAAFDGALERVDKQLRRYKRRIKNHKKPEIAENHFDYLATKYTLAAVGEEEEAPESDNPIIIAEKPTRIEKLSVSDAVMKMDLENLAALMFVNHKNGNLNVVYRRSDGNIAWVDPQIRQ